MPEWADEVRARLASLRLSPTREAEIVEELWPNDTASAVIGRLIRQGAVNGADITVVGVVQDVKPGALDRDLPPQLYRPHHQASTGRMSVVVRTSQDPLLALRR